MYIWERLELEEQQREAEYLESIGPVGRLVDNELYYCLAVVVLMLTGFLIGFGIGSIL